jgi:hypothetical protein
MEERCAGQNLAAESPQTTILASLRCRRRACSDNPSSVAHFGVEISCQTELRLTQNAAALFESHPAFSGADGKDLPSDRTDCAIFIAFVMQTTP